MTTIAHPLPLTDTHAPSAIGELADLVRSAYESSIPLYPIGGATSLDFGLAPRAAGWGVDLTALARVVDYPARDMTITVEAGIRMAELAQVLAHEGQRLPVDAAQAGQATLGGLVATNFSGPRRYGHGTIRDYVIGIQAIDGRGVAFKAGGRVVKNVAGYDFCKLLVGSLGTLAITGQVTLKVKPLAERSVYLACNLASWDTAERLLAGLVTSQSTPAAIELLAGPAWSQQPLAAGDGVAQLVVGLEGSQIEVDWMVDALRGEWRSAGIDDSQLLAGGDAEALEKRLIEFGTEPAALVLKLATRPGRVADLAATVRSAAPDASLAAHAGNGIVVARFPTFEAADIARLLFGVLHPAVAAVGGSAVAWKSSEPLTSAAVWGPSRNDLPMLRRVKQQFDPRGLLNPGRFFD